MDTLTKTNATLAAEKSALAQRRDALQGEIALLIQARDEQANLVAKRDSDLELAQRRIAETDAKNLQSVSAMTELDARQHMLNDEVARAEAQIDLIKELLFREPGL